MALLVLGFNVRLDRLRIRDTLTFVVECSVDAMGPVLTHLCLPAVAVSTLFALQHLVTGILVILIHTSVSQENLGL